MLADRGDPIFDSQPAEQGNNSRDETFTHNHLRTLAVVTDHHTSAALREQGGESAGRGPGAYNNNVGNSVHGFDKTFGSLSQYMQPASPQSSMITAAAEA